MRVEERVQGEKGDALQRGQIDEEGAGLLEGAGVRAYAGTTVERDGGLEDGP